MEQGADFKIADAASYDLKAESFDQHTERYSHYAVDGIARHVDMSDTGEIVDIGCGTGVVALALAQRARASRITGIDLSDGMLDLACTKGLQAGFDNLVFEKGDAERLALPDASISQVVSLYAWRHFPAPASAAAEAFRILRPGGRIIVAVGSAPPLFSTAGLQAVAQKPWRRLAQMRGRELAACEHIDGLVGRLLPASEAHEAADWTHEHHGFTGSLGGLLRDAGFLIEGSEWLGKEYTVPSAEDFWDLQTTFSSVARKRLNAADAQRRSHVRQTFDLECARVLATGGRLVYRVGAALVTARKANAG